jgi:hypothetical protein
MSDSNLVKARASIVWIAALLAAFGAVAWIERHSGVPLIAAPAGASTAIGTADAPPLPAGMPSVIQPRPLEPAERHWAASAWSYFDANTDASTGLVNSVDNYPSTTLWDTGSYLLALISAERLGILPAAQFDARMAKALDALARLPLMSDALPNKSYDVRTLAMTDYRNQPAPGGTGWSALDIARVLVPLRAVVWRYPQHTPAVRKLIARWKLSQLESGAQLQGLSVSGNGETRVQEGRMGYEQYAARALLPYGLDLEKATRWDTHLRWLDVGGVAVPADTRTRAQTAALDAVVSEPFMLEGLELGWTASSRAMAWRVYKAQETRFNQTGVLTASTEDHIDREPYFVYTAVHAEGRPWAAVGPEGTNGAPPRSVSLKAAFAWHALLHTPYTMKLVTALAPLQTPGKGFQGGIYEAGGQPNRSINLNTNAVVLESLAYIQEGPVAGMR